MINSEREGGVTTSTDRSDGLSALVLGLHRPPRFHISREKIERKDSVLKNTMSQECMLTVENRCRMDSSWKVLLSPKSVICRYYGLPGGCVRGEKCFYAHGEEELQKQRTGESSPGLGHSTTLSPRLQVAKIKHSEEDLAKKVFVGGLSSSIESDDLREFFEEKFGPVKDAVVIETHLGDQVHSRGFGFVTFESEKSVVSAVQAHFVNIFGKKVEIKSAVPRLGFSQLVIGKGGSEMSTPLNGAGISMDASKSDVIRQRLLDIKISPVITNSQAQNDVELPYWIQRRYEVDTGLSLNKEADCATTTPLTAPGSDAECRSWVPIFEHWLPKFLLEVCDRLKQGEWYPLSSLKGDFRATCGLELDHEAIGFHKLNDFIRSLPHLCRIKIVPVGLGPATHMVLLPTVSRMTPPQLRMSTPWNQHIGNRARESLVEMGRSYAAAICQGTTSSGNGSLISGRFTLAENSVDNLSRECALQASVSMDQSGAVSNAHENVNLNLRQPSGLVEENSGQENWDPDNAFANRLTTNFIEQSCLQCMDSHGSHNTDFHFSSGIPDPSDFFIHQLPESNSRTKIVETGVRGNERPKLPTEHLTPSPFSNFKHERCAYSSPWEQHVPNNQETCVQKSSLGNNLQEESAHINVAPIVVGKARGPLQKLFLLHAIDQDREKISTPCGLCKRKAIWISWPCKHYNVCSACRDSLYRCWQKGYDSSCPVCSCVVEKWYAFYY